VIPEVFQPFFGRHAQLYPSAVMNNHLGVSTDSKCDACSIDLVKVGSVVGKEVGFVEISQTCFSR